MDLVQFKGAHVRRRFLRGCACGLGTLALSDLLATDGLTADVEARPGAASPPRTHFVPRAKSVIFLFMSGAPSQLDLVDPKPEMQRWHGKRVPDSMLAGLSDALI